MNKLEENRIIINQIDKEIAFLLNKRFQAVSEILKYKKENNIQIYDKNREEIIINKNIEYANTNIKDYYLEIYKKIIEESKKYQEKLLNE